MATLTIRPTSGSGNSWNNIADAYDNNTSTAANVTVLPANYESRTATFNISVNGIPKGSTINSATLTIRARGNVNNNITLYADINENSNSRVINKSLPTPEADYTADITSYINSLSTLKLTAHISSILVTTLYVYDISITIDYTRASTDISNVFIGGSALVGVLLGTTNIESVYVGNILVYGSSSGSSGGSTEGTNILPVFSEWTNELKNGTISGDYSMSSSGGGLITQNLNITKGVKYTLKADAIGSQTCFNLFSSSMMSALQITPSMLTNNEYTFTATDDFATCMIIGPDGADSYSLSVTNLRIYAS